jgi:putative SOS response-associated peptidase YedK
LESKGVYAFADLYDTWRDPNGEKIQSCMNITTTPNQFVADMHYRMPVILRDTASWLNPEIKDTKDVLSFLKPYPADQIIKYTVSRDVGNVKNTSASLRSL